jgi:chromosome partitioning protein
MRTTTAIVNRKGGVGKTTTSVNLAADLAILGKKVLLIDLDAQGGSTIALGINKRTVGKTIYHTFADNDPLVSVIQHTTISDLDVAPSNLDMDGAELLIAPRMARELILRRLLAEVEDSYDQVILDCAPTMGLITLNALLACDQVVVPVMAEYHSLEGTEDIRQTLEDISTYYNHRPRTRYLVTMTSRVNNHGKEVIKVLREQFGKDVYETLIPRNIKVAEAPSFGKPVAIYAPNSPGAKAYKRFAEEFLNEQ